MKRIALALCFTVAPALAGTPVTTPVGTFDKTVIGQEIVVPPHPTVLVTIVTFQPGDKTAAHKHPYPHYGYMLEGTLTITNTETGKSFDLKPGDFLVEMTDAWHTGENRGTVPVRILVVDQVPPGVNANNVKQAGTK
jgi:quercetin dioxygenase-like cupin family protein